MPTSNSLQELIHPLLYVYKSSCDHISQGTRNKWILLRVARNLITYKSGNISTADKSCYAWVLGQNPIASSWLLNMQ